MWGTRVSNGAVKPNGGETTFKVVRLRVASPLTAQTEMNSVTEAAKNWELVLADIFAKVTDENLHKSVQLSP